MAPAELREQALAMRDKAADPVAARVQFALWLMQVELLNEARGVWRALTLERPDDAGLKRMAQ